MQGPFNAALAQAEAGAVMVLDEEINPFKRIWCLFEISRLKALNQPFELICEMGPLSKPESLAVQQTDPTAATRLLQNTCEALWQVSALKAKSISERRPAPHLGGDCKSWFPKAAQKRRPQGHWC